MRREGTLGRSGFRQAGAWLAVSLAYYLGAEIGFAFQSPSSPQSVLWLPNSILLATLLLVPMSQWLLYLAAAFPAQMLVGWQIGTPMLPIGLLFVTNCSDAALGAFLVRRLVPQPFRFDNLRSTAIFAAFGAALSPVLLSFADAAISVATGWTAAYWAAFSTRVHSNVLTHLIVVPAMVTALMVDVRKVQARQVIEAAISFVALLATSIVAFGQPSGSGASTPLLYLPLPLLVWGAVRFGPGGAAWTVLLVAFVASWNALHGRGPFTTQAPQDDVQALQLFLLSISAPLLLLSATIKERNLTVIALQDNEATVRQSLARVQDLTGKLMAVQELERMRIGRELHDDVSQRLAALSIGLSNLRNHPGARDEAEVDAIASLQGQATALVDGIRQLSHDLHVGVLDKTGLVPTLRAHCARFGLQQHMSVSFQADGDFDDIPRDVAIGLYRIVQEALRNVSRHAAASHASVTMTRSSASLHLTIRDRGRGFDVIAGRRAGGLGLLSMEERTRLIGGALEIDSGPGGTMVRIDLPLVHNDEAEASAETPAPQPMDGDIIRPAPRLPRVLLADDHQIVLDGLRHLLRDCCQIVGSVGDGPSLVAAAVELNPDIVIADISMPGFGAIEALKLLRARGVASKVIMLTMHMDGDIVRAGLAAGAAGYVPKHVAGQELVAAIRHVSRGLTYVTPRMVDHNPRTSLRA